MQIKEAEVRKVPIKDMKMATYNPRKDLKPGDEEYEDLKRSLETFGYVDKIVWNERTGNVVGGHQRLKVLKDAGLQEVTVSVVDLEKNDEMALNVALNKIAGSWDDLKLIDVLAQLRDADYDVSLTGFKDVELEDMLGITAEEVIEDEVPELPEEPTSKPGEIYQLGNHRLMCGDSTSQADMAALMNGIKAEMLWTDPPWNVNYGADDNDGHYRPRTIQNDNMSTEQFYSFLTDAFANATDHLKPGAMTYAVMSAQEWGNMMNVMRENSFHWSSTIIWSKDKLVLARKDYHTQYEPIWYGWLDGAPRLKPLEDRKQSDIWEFERPRRSDEHPTMKPVGLVAKCIENSSNARNVVLDPFGGSGTTLIAADQLGRTCYMMELDPKYVDVIIERWEKLTGKTAVKLTAEGTAND